MTTVRDVVTGVSGLLVLLALTVLAVGIVGLIVYAFVDSGAWKPVVGFLIAAVVIGAVSIGIRSGDRT